MILVADSGSTKADWISGTHEGVSGSHHTKGFNPFFHDRNFILNELQNNSSLSDIRSRVSTLYFFGAGCSSSARNEIIREALASFFSNAVVVVDHDILGSAIALCDGKPGIACILGTGSNVCLFDGNKITDTRHGLGYVLGDEGSGSYYGKKLLAYYLYKILPADLEKEFRLRYRLDREEIISKVYQEPNPNVYLASFATFLSDFNSHPFITELVSEGMRDYLRTNVKSFPEYENLPAHFVGSIAFHFREILKSVAVQEGVSIGNIIQKPIQALASWFLNGGKMPS
jgi:glucosamine kinase